jgi:hypothetical protein
MSQRAVISLRSRHRFSLLATAVDSSGIEVSRRLVRALQAPPRQRIQVTPLRFAGSLAGFAGMQILLSWPPPMAPNTPRTKFSHTLACAFPCHTSQNRGHELHLRTCHRRRRASKLVLFPCGRAGRRTCPFSVEARLFARQRRWRFRADKHGHAVEARPICS